MKKRGIVDKIRGIDYLEIPEVEILINEGDFIEFKNSKDSIGFALLIFPILIIAMIVNYIKQPSIFINNILLSILIAGFLIGGFIYFIRLSKKDPTIIILTIKGINHKSIVYQWRFISKMFVKKQYDGDNYNHSLILEYNYGPNVSLSIDSLDKDIETVISEIGKYYWNWKRLENKNAT